MGSSPSRPEKATLDFDIDPFIPESKQKREKQGGQPKQQPKKTAEKAKDTTPKQTEAVKDKDALRAEIEQPKGGVANIDELKKKAEKVESDPNVEAAERINQLDGRVDVVAQKEELTALHTALTNVLVKLKKEGVDIAQIDSPQKLYSAVTVSAITLTLPEQTAVERLGSIISVPGPTSRRIGESWPDTVEAAEEASKGLHMKYWEHLKKNPVGTIGLTVAGVAGIYLTAQGIKALLKAAMGSEDDDKSGEGGKGWMRKEVIIPIAIMIGGALLGKEKLKEMLANAGLDFFDIQDRVKKGKEFTEEQKKKIEKAGPQVQAQIDKMRKKSGAAETTDETSDEDTDEAVSLENAAQADAKKENLEKAEKEAEEVARKNAKALEFDLPRELAMKAYCWQSEYQPADKKKIRNAIDDMRTKKVSDIIALWKEYESSKDRTIPRRNKLMTFGNYVDPKHIYAAAMVVSKAAHEYEKRTGESDHKELTLKQFFVDRLYHDASVRLFDSVQSTITESIGDASVVGFFKTPDLDFSKIESALQNIGVDMMHKLAGDFDIHLKGKDEVETRKIVEDFTALTGMMYAKATMQMSADEALRHVDTSQYHSKSVEGAKRFFEAIKKRTEEEIIPSAHARFNLDKKHVDVATNADIIKNDLNMDMSFKHAVQLNLVTEGLDLKSRNHTPSSEVQEVSFLFTCLAVVNAKSPERKTAYLAELSNILAEQPSDIYLPSLRFMQPILQQLVNRGVDKFQEQTKRVLAAAKVLAPSHTADGLKEYEEHLEKLKHADAITFAKDQLRGHLGGFMLPVDLILAMYESGKFVTEDIAGIENSDDLFEVIKKAGGEIFFWKEGNGEVRGVVHFLGNVFYTRPIGIVHETLKSAFELDPVGMVKVWVGGTAPLMTLGAVRGAWKASRGHQGWLKLTRWSGGAKGALEALKYPIEAPLWATKKIVNFGVSTIHKGSKPFRGAKEVVSWTGDFLKYRSAMPGQNMTNILRSARLFEHFSGADLLPATQNLRIEVNRMRALYQAGETWSWEKFIRGIQLGFAKMKLRAVNIKEMTALMLKNPAQFVAQIAQNYNMMMAEKYAIQFANRYNALFKSPIIDISTSAISHKDFSVIQEKLHLLKRFIKDASESPDVFKRIRVLIASAESSDDVATLADDIETILGKAFPDLAPTEKSAMAKQMTSSKSVDIWEGKAKEGFDFIEKTGKKATKAAKAGAEIADDAAKAGTRTVEAVEAELKIVQDRIAAARRSNSVVELADRRLEKALLQEADELRRGVSRSVTAGGEVVSDASRTVTAAEAGRATIELAPELGETSKALSEARKQLKAVTTTMKEAERDLAIAKRSAQGIGKEGSRLSKLRFDTSKVQQTAIQRSIDGAAAKVKLEQHISNLEKLRDLEKSLARADSGSTQAATLERQIIASRAVAEDSLQTSSRALNTVNKIGKIGRAARILGRTVAIGGAGINVFMAGSSFHEALTTDVEGRAGLKTAEGAMWTVSAAADIGAVAVLFGSTGTAATIASYGALPLVPLTYAGSTVLETVNEETITDYEWVQKSPYEALHQFYSTADSCSLGDAWYTLGIESRIEKSLAIKKETMKKIYRGLVAIQSDPSLLQYINEEPPSKAKDQEIERRIAENYSVYHEFFFEQGTPTMLSTYNQAQQFILDAQMFHDVMTERDKKKEKGEEFTLRSGNTLFSLHEDRYDIIGGMDDPHPRKLFIAQQVVKAYKEGMIGNLDEALPTLSSNMDRMDTSYLLRLYVQMALVLQDKSAIKKLSEENPGIPLAFQSNITLIENYLKVKRGVNMIFAVGDPVLKEPRMSASTILEHIDSMGNEDNDVYLKFEADNYTITPAIHAMTKLAEYFGYSGPPSELRLREFFDINAATFRGVAWDGDKKSWVLNERGYEFDDVMGPTLSASTVHKIMVRMREQPENIIDHRSDSIFVNAREYRYEVQGLAQILEDGIAEGEKRGYKREQSDFKLKGDEDFVAPPQAVDFKFADYEQEPDALKKEYKTLIEEMIAETGWSQLRYRINDEHSITLSRGDGNASTELRREGHEWNVDGLEGGLLLTQAVALGNLKNWTEQWLEKADISAGSDEPFFLHGSSIYFDVAWSPINREFMKEWNQYYIKLAIGHDFATKFLNKWFKTRVYQKQAA